MLVDSLDVNPEAFCRATGWEIKAEGACKGEVCIALPGYDFDLVRTTERLGMAVVHDQDLGLWAIGPETVGGRALATAQAPDLVLLDIDGNEFRLSSLRDRKVVLISWAPY
jgi:hypothetical protein